MNLLLDTHMLLWAAAGRLPAKAERLVTDGGNILFFSPASMWEIVIKSGLGRDDFSVDCDVLYRELLDHQYRELYVSSRHTLMVKSLPLLHKDPFDRMLLAQATVEGCYLLTSDRMLKEYPGPVVHIPSQEKSG